jgi:hypothetical protein
VENLAGGKTMNDREELEKERDWYRERIVWCFSEDGKPVYYQGSKGEHEICEPITAEEANGLVRKIEELNQKLVDDSEDFATLGLPHGCVTEKLLVTRDALRSLAKAAFNYQSALLNEEQSTDYLLEKAIDHAHAVLKVNP